MAEHSPKGTYSDPSQLGGNQANLVETVDIAPGGAEKIDGLTSIGLMSEIGYPDSEHVMRVARLVLPGGQVAEVISQLGSDGKPVNYYLLGLRPDVDPNSGEPVYKPTKRYAITPGMRVGRIKNALRDDNKTPVQIDVDLGDLGSPGQATAVSREQLQLDITDTGIVVTCLAKDGSAPVFLARGKNEVAVTLESESEVEDEDNAVTVPREVLDKLKQQSSEMSSERAEELSEVGAEVVELSEVVEPPEDEVLGASAAKKVVGGTSRLIQDQIDELDAGKGRTVTVEIPAPEPAEESPEAERPKELSAEEKRARQEQREREYEAEFAALGTAVDGVVDKLAQGDHYEAHDRLAKLTDGINSMTRTMSEVLESLSGQMPLGAAPADQHLERAVKTLQLLYASDKVNPAQVRKEAMDLLDRAMVAWRHSESTVSAVTEAQNTVYRGHVADELKEVTHLFYEFRGVEQEDPNKVRNFKRDMDEFVHIVDSEFTPGLRRAITRVEQDNIAQRITVLINTVSGMKDNDDSSYPIRIINELRSDLGNIIHDLRTTISSSRNASNVLDGVCNTISQRKMDLNKSKR